MVQESPNSHDVLSLDILNQSFSFFSLVDFWFLGFLISLYEPVLDFLGLLLVEPATMPAKVANTVTKILMSLTLAMLTDGNTRNC